MNKEEKKDLVKMVGGCVAGFGTSCVVTNAIKATTPLSMSPISKVGVWIGSIILSGIFSNMANKYVEETVDQIDEAVSSYDIDVKVQKVIS